MHAARIRPNPLSTLTELARIETLSTPQTDEEFMSVDPVDEPISPRTVGTTQADFGDRAVRDRNVAAVRHWLALLEAEDIETWQTLWAEQARQDMPYAPPGFPKSFDRDRLFEQYSGLPQAYDYMRYPALELFETQDPKVVIARFHGDIQLKGNSGRYDNRYVSFFVFDDAGKLVRVIEHFNPLVLMQGGAFGEDGRPNTDGGDTVDKGASRADWAHDFFAAVDAHDPEKVAQRVTEDARLTFGVQPAVVGRDAIRRAFGDTFAKVDATRHELTGVWTGRDGDREVISAEARVTYTLPGGRQVTVPCTSTLRLEGDLVADYRIFIDLAPVFGSQPEGV